VRLRAPNGLRCRNIARHCATRRREVAALVEVKPLQSLERLYRDVLSGARNAQVYVLGYPRLFSPHPAIFCSGIDVAEAHWITAKEDALNNEIAQAVKRIRSPRLHYIDTSTAFSGGELCSKNHTQYVTGLVVDWQNWVYSFHPTAEGAEAVGQHGQGGHRQRPALKRRTIGAGCRTGSSPCWHPALCSC